MLDGLGKLTLILVLYIGPFFFIPALMQRAGGMFSTLTGVMNDRSKGLFDRNRKWRGDQRKATWDRAKEGNRFTGNNRVSRTLSRGIEYGANIKKGGVNPMAFRGRMNEALSKGAYHEAKELREKNEDFAALAQDDDLLRVVRQARSRGDVVRMLRAAGRYTPEAAARVEAVMRSGSAEAVEMAATTQLAATGTGYGNDPAAMFEAIRQTTHGDRDMATRMLGDMRALAGQSGQVMMGGAGFGATQREMFRYMDADDQTRAATAQQVRLEMANEVLQGSAPGQIASARRAHVEAIAPVMRDNLMRALNSGDQHAVNRQLAQIAGMYDTMAQVKPENATVLADQVLAQQVAHPAGGGPAMSVQQMIDQARGNTVFQEARREYQSAVPPGAQAAAAQAAAQAGQPPAGGGQPGQPGGPAPSDRRLKRDITALTRDAHGNQLYRFKYLWSDQEYVGVMAQDILQTNPRVVTLDNNGYYLVDYAALGTRMYTYQEWSAATNNK
jgi:hypothetical protein